jgi:transcriptional antiterminator
MNIRMIQMVNANASTVLISRHVALAKLLKKPHDPSTQFLLNLAVFAAVESHKIQTITEGVKQDINFQSIQNLNVTNAARKSPK